MKNALNAWKEHILILKKGKSESIGLCYFQQQKHEENEKYFEKALELCSRSTDHRVKYEIRAYDELGTSSILFLLFSMKKKFIHIPN